MKFLKCLLAITLLSMPLQLSNAQAKVNWPRVVNEFIIPCGAAVLVADALVKGDEEARNGARIITCGIFMNSLNPSGRAGFGGKSRSEIEEQVDEWERTPAMHNLLPPQ